MCWVLPAAPGIPNWDGCDPTVRPSLAGPFNLELNLVQGKLPEYREVRCSVGSQESAYDILNAAKFSF